MNAAVPEAALRPPRRLEAIGLEKSYGARKVVKDVRLAVDSGEVVGLLGPNGAGKTTSFYMIVGLVRADAGQISIEGERVERRRQHYVQEFFCLFCYAQRFNLLSFEPGVSFFQINNTVRVDGFPFLLR